MKTKAMAALVVLLLCAVSALAGAVAIGMTSTAQADAQERKEPAPATADLKGRKVAVALGEDANPLARVDEVEGLVLEQTETGLLVRCTSRAESTLQEGGWWHRESAGYTKTEFYPWSNIRRVTLVE